MLKKDDIIRENIELKGRIELAEKWMRREVATSILRIQKEQSTKKTRTAIHNIFEAEGLDILTRRILKQFDNSLKNAPKYTLERLIDAEIYWQTLQQYPHMDALPIVLAYQKIFDAWIEDRLVAPFRLCHREIQINPEGKIKSLFITRLSHSLQRRESEALDRDIENILHKNYTLSIGRLYQIVYMIREDEPLSSNIERLITYWKKEIPKLFEILISDTCFLPFTDLIELEVFSRKRHEAKVSYSDAKRIRELVIDETIYKSFFEMIFSI